VDVFQTGSGTSGNMNANEVIATLASRQLQSAVHPNDQANTSQSSDDVIPTCIHLSAALLLHNQMLPANEQPTHRVSHEPCRVSFHHSGASIWSGLAAFNVPRMTDSKNVQSV
tara:strand:+ start:1097 stop:1435 length:339 start_codon:yes stop_codon:yes gene_type:complete